MHVRGRGRGVFATVSSSRKAKKGCARHKLGRSDFLARQRQTAHLAIRTGVRWVRERASRADLVPSSSSSTLSIDSICARNCVSSSGGGGSVGRNINVGRDLEPVDHLWSSGRGGTRIGRVGAAGVGPCGRGRSCGVEPTQPSACRSVSTGEKSPELVVLFEQNGPCSCATTMKVCQFGEAKS